jgi:predicted nucleotidyltransferase
VPRRWSNETCIENSSPGRIRTSVARSLLARSNPESRMIDRYTTGLCRRKSLFRYGYLMGENGRHLHILIRLSGPRLDMNHRERVVACREVSERLLRRYYHDIIATAVVGSVARGDDREYSDIDFQVLVRRGSKLRSHSFVLNECLFSVNVRTEADWREELTRGNDHLPLAIGSLMNVLPAHDPTGAFARLRRLASGVPGEAWRNGVRDGLSGICEDLGRVRNFYAAKDWDSFRMMSGSVATGIALTYANLTRQILQTEKDLMKVFENGNSSDIEVARAFRVAAKLETGEDVDVMEALNFLGEFLFREGAKQSALPDIFKSAWNYSPP